MNIENFWCCKLISGENTLRCLALATIDKPTAKEKMDLETSDVTKYEVSTYYAHQ